jgi:autonomous glycyl radical cofactor GrcA
MTVWYSFWSFGIFSPFWYVFTKKNLAALVAASEFADDQVIGVQMPPRWEYDTLLCNLASNICSTFAFAQQMK